MTQDPSNPETSAVPPAPPDGAADHASNIQLLDLTGDPAAGGYTPPKLVPYNPEEDREKKRGTIALILVCLLAGIVAGAFIYVLISLFILKSFRDLDSLKTLLEIVFAPVVGLVGSVTGFYFGEKSKSK